MELPRLSVLNEQYAVRSILGDVGPFDVFYLAWDLENEEQVVIREFLPVQLFERVAPGTSLRPSGNNARQLLEFGLKHYVKELALTSKISHPNIVQVRSFFKENNTLYSIHDYHPGMPLQSVLDQHNGKISARTAITIMMPFMDGIRTGHGARLIHGKISPQSIYLSKQGRPMVLAFNTTFLYLASQGNMIEAIQDPGFSPPEQYTPRGKHGPWSDVYSCAATLFTMLTGEVLPDAATRLRGDEASDMINESFDLPDELKEVLIQAVSLSTNKRPQSIDAFSALLAESLSIPGSVSTPISSDKPPRSLSKPPSDFQSAPDTDSFRSEPQGNRPASDRPQPSSSHTAFAPATPRTKPYMDKAPFDDVYSNGRHTPYTGGSGNGNGTATYENSIFSPTISQEYSNGRPETSNGFNLFNAPAQEHHLPAPSNGFGVTKSDSLPKRKSYEKIEPETAYEYGSRKPRTAKKTGRIILYAVTGTLIIFLAFVIFNNLQNSSAVSYNPNDTSEYDNYVLAGDSLYKLAFDVSQTNNAHLAPAIYENALENYLAAQSLSKENPMVRRRIKEIEMILKTPADKEDFDEKDYLAYISSGDSLMRIAERTTSQGDSALANVLYTEARDKYFIAFENFPKDSLANARLRMVSERMAAPERENRPPPAVVQAPAPSEEQIKEQLFARFKLQGDSAFINKNYDEARRKYIEALEQKPGDPEVTRLLNDATRSLNRSVQIGKYREHINAGNKLLNAGRLAEARREFELALQALPEDQVANQAIFEIDTKLKEQSQREQNYFSHRTRGDLLLEQQKYEEALQSYRAALAAKPDDEYAKIKIDETLKDIQSLSDYREELPEGMIDNNGIYNYTEVSPELIGGRDVLQARLRYPPKAIEANVEGRVIVQMLVDETGKMSNPTIVKGLGYGCDEEVLRVIRGARFKPGRVGGQPVSSWHTLYFEFTR